MDMLKLKRALLPAALLAVFASLPAAQAADYVPGFVWDRSDDWVAGPQVGWTTGNPAPDKLGNPVWSYEYTSGGPIGSANPWYLAEKHAMIWDHWDPAGPTPEDLWVRADNLEPKINRTTLSNSRSLRWNSWEYQSLVRWINPVGDGTIVDITGSLRVDWAGWGVSPDVDVDVIIGFKDFSSNTLTLLFERTVQNPTPGLPNPPFPRVIMPLGIHSLRMDAGDSLLVSLRAKTAPSELDSWIVMYDDVKIRYVTTVPEPAQWSMFAGGLILVGVLARRSLRPSGAPA